MRRLWKWLKRGLFALVLFIALLLVPVAYNELACVAEPSGDSHTPLITDAAWQRPESRTLTTYPEWHIVHAYDDYAKVISTGDPHDFGYFRAIKGFWSSLCALSKASGAHGGFTTASKQTIYTIGVSFTAELLAKAAYEEIPGRLFAMIDGDRRSVLEDISARQAADYATFLQQTPWYKWNFTRDVVELKTNATDRPRDRERAIALGFEYEAKQAYAGIIAAAVEGMGEDNLRLRMILNGIDAAALPDSVTLITERPEGIEVETPRYRTLTNILVELAGRGADFIEIAGNDDILFTAITATPPPDALFTFPRQGYGDTRALFMVKVPDLADIIREGGLSVEHIHDY